MDSQLQYNISELVQFMDQCNDSNVVTSYSGLNHVNSPTAFNYTSQYELESKSGYEQQKSARQESIDQHFSAMSFFPLHTSPKIQVLNLRDQECKEIQKNCRFSKVVEDVHATAPTDMREALNYDELFDTFINSEVDVQTLKDSVGVLRPHSPLPLPLPLTPKPTPNINMKDSMSRSYVFENENSKDRLYFDDADERDVGRIFRYPDNSNQIFNIGTLKLASNSYKEAKVVSASVNKTIDDEFELKSKYFRSFNNSLKRRQKSQPEEIRSKIRKRNNPTTDEVEWKPLSIFTVYTNFKPEAIDDTDYFENIPQTSCFGRLNMRVKRAWTRGPNKVKLK